MLTNLEEDIKNITNDANIVMVDIKIFSNSDNIKGIRYHGNTLNELTSNASEFISRCGDYVSLNHIVSSVFNDSNLRIHVELRPSAILVVEPVCGYKIEISSPEINAIDIFKFILDKISIFDLVKRNGLLGLPMRIIFSKVVNNTQFINLAPKVTRNDQNEKKEVKTELKDTTVKNEPSKAPKSEITNAILKEMNETVTNTKNYIEELRQRKAKGEDVSRQSTLSDEEKEIIKKKDEEAKRRAEEAKEASFKAATESLDSDDFGNDKDPTIIGDLPSNLNPSLKKLFKPITGGSLTPRTFMNPGVKDEPKEDVKEETTSKEQKEAEDGMVFE